MPLVLALILALLAAVHRPALEARFIGNMAFAITDGSTTVMTDFPYQSGYSRYMSYPSSDIRSTTTATLALITHRHADHWERKLFEKTTWSVAGPQDVVAETPAFRVVPLISPTTFGPVQIEPVPTPHADVSHYSYVVTWHGRRLYFSGDTEDAGHLSRLEKLDVAFVSPWLFRSANRRGIRIDTKRIVIYHHEAGEGLPECRGDCTVPRQGATIHID